jgi:RNA recognition motif-containing protein
MSWTFYVGNLPYKVGETELQELFARAGSVFNSRSTRRRRWRQ